MGLKICLLDTCSHTLLDIYMFIDPGNHRPRAPVYPITKQTPTSTSPSKRMSLSIQNKLIQTDQVRLAVKQVKVLQRLSEPEALHRVLMLRFGGHNILKTRVRNIRLRMLRNSLEHLPPLLHPDRIRCQTVHDEDWFYGFWTKLIGWIIDAFKAIACPCPDARTVRITGLDVREVGHDSRRRVAVAPNTSVSQLCSRFQLILGIADARA